MPQHTTIDKRLPIARWQTKDITFAFVDVDRVVPHALNPKNANDVMFQVIDTKVWGSVYRGSKAPQKDYIVLRTSVIGTYRIQLFIEAQA